MQFSTFVSKDIKIREKALRHKKIFNINKSSAMRIKKNLVAYFLIGFSLSSCISNKKLVYLQEFPDNAPVSIEGDLVAHELDEYLLQYNDIVDISLRTTSPELNELLDIGG